MMLSDLEVLILSVHHKHRCPKNHKKSHFASGGGKVGLGLGDSLTALDELILTELKLILMRVRLTNKPDEYTYDNQGMYMHSLMKKAKWDEYKLRIISLEV